jgi:hypothetical protein
MDSRKANLRLTPSMEEAFVSLVFLHKAYMKGAEIIADKYTKIVLSLSKMNDFNSQGPPLAAGAIQKKFNNLLKNFRDKHGLSEEEERTNLSALKEDLSPMDQHLESIHCELEERRMSEYKKKASEAEKKRNISDITDAVIRGGGKEELLKLADATQLSCSSTSSAGVKEFCRMNSGKGAKKRGRAQSQLLEDEEFDAIKNKSWWKKLPKLHETIEQDKNF